jgi:hypothetical protein
VKSTKNAEQLQLLLTEFCWSEPKADFLPSISQHHKKEKLLLAEFFQYLFLSRFQASTVIIREPITSLSFLNEWIHAIQDSQL